MPLLKIVNISLVPIWDSQHLARCLCDLFIPQILADSRQLTEFKYKMVQSHCQNQLNYYILNLISNLEIYNSFQGLSGRAMISPASKKTMRTGAISGQDTTESIAGPGARAFSSLSQLHCPQALTSAPVLPLPLRNVTPRRNHVQEIPQIASLLFPGDHNPIKSQR